jgi:hypothetical protein
MKRITAAAALGWAFVLAPMPGAASNNDSKATPEKSVGQRSPSDAKAAKPQDGLDTCKRDADGMKGPERSRFMTACLKERKQ